MSVASTNPVVSEVGNGLKTDFDFAFKVFLATDVRVYVETGVGTDAYTEKIYTTDFTVTFNTANENGTVIFSTAPLTGRKVIVTRTIPITQGSVLPLEGKMPAKVVEDALDRLTLIAQDLEASGGSGGASPVAPSNVVEYAEGAYADKPTAPAIWLLWYSTDMESLEQWVPTAGKWFLIG